jgi:hypothetical protein
MSAGQEETAPAAAGIVEYGRYRVFETDDGLIIARATDTCEDCQTCGCGDQQPVLTVPDVRRGRAYLMQWMVANANTGVLGALRGVLNRG